MRGAKHPATTLSFMLLLLMNTVCKMRNPCWLVMVLCIALAGCSAPPTLPVKSTEIPSFVFTPSATVVMGTPSPSPTNSLTFSATPLPLQTPILSPAPTLTMDEEVASVAKMLQDNGGCRLPCWWGFTPGETSLQATKVFFAALGKEIRPWYFEGSENYNVYFDLAEHFQDQLYSGKDVLARIGVRALPPVHNDEYLYGDAQFVVAWEAYLLPHLLTEYGPPAQIWVYVGVRAAPWAPFDLLLFYPEQGILARYEAPAIWSDEVFRMCQYQMSIDLHLWSPQYSPERAQLPVWAAELGDLSVFRPVEEATGMTISEFVQKMRQPDPDICLETPQSLWLETP